MSEEFQKPYQDYLAKNPGASFADYYVAFVDGIVQSGEVHNTIGTTCKKPEEKQQQAMGILETFCDLGLEPHDYCLDIGCGSLGNAGPLIGFLETGHYIGADLTDKFWQYGQARFETEFLVSKAPKFFLLDAFFVESAAEFQPKFAFASGVVNHIPPSEIDRFMRNLLEPLASGAKGFFSFKEGPVQTQVNDRAFQYPRSRIAQYAARYGAVELLGDDRFSGENQFFFHKTG